MEPTKPLTPGTRAPAFTLASSPYEFVSLKDFLGRAVLLSFYAEDWDPVCTDQVTLLRDFLDQIHQQAAVVAISVDGVWCHRAFARAHGIAFPLLSDSEPRGAVARAYGVFNESKDLARRSVFAIDRHGVIAASHVYPAGLNLGALEFLATLEGLRVDDKGALPT